MSKDAVTVVYSVLLILLGVVGYFATGTSSITAFIPSFFGILILIVYFIVRKSTKQWINPGILAALGILGFLGTFTGIVNVINLLQGETVARESAAVSQAIMAILSLAFVGLLLVSGKKREAH